MYADGFPTKIIPCNPPHLSSYFIMNFLIAPNAMKGALTAQQICTVLQRTLRRKYPSSEMVSTPVADGGNGTLDCLMNAFGGTVYSTTVTGPVPTMKVNARYGITPQKIGIIESADAIGLHHVTPSPDTIAQSTSRGIGELIMAMQRHQCVEIRIGLGGTATNDGGAGAAAALGFEMFDEHDELLKEGSIPLLQLQKIVGRKTKPAVPPIRLLTDVQNPLLGDNGATYTFARQKGATDEQLPYLEAALINFADVVEAHAGKEFRSVSGAGAAGGLGFGLMALCNASVTGGIDAVLDAIGFDDKLASCDCVLTAEGMLDEQTLFGKGIAGIALRAQRLNKPVHAFVGKVRGDADRLRRQLGLASLTQISPNDLPPAQAMRDASWLLADAVYHHSF
jgi:glycerate kinase